MKKVLLATTVLAMSSVVAAAEVTVGGDARMGIFFDGTDSVIQYRARAKFAMTGETDTGLTFGAGFNLQDESEEAGTAAVYISGAFGTLSIGADNDNALQATRKNVPHLGVLENAGSSRGTTIGAGNLVLYTYTAGGLTFAASFSDPNDVSNGYSFGAQYAAGDYSVAVGYEDNGVDDHILVSGSAAFGTTTVVGYVGERNSTDSQYGLAVTAAFDATAVTLRLKNDFDGDDHMGIGATYDLGGGAKVGASVNKVTGNDTTADLGMSFSF